MKVSEIPELSGARSAVPGVAGDRGARWCVQARLKIEQSPGLGRGRRVVGREQWNTVAPRFKVHAGAFRNQLRPRVTPTLAPVSGPVSKRVSEGGRWRCDRVIRGLRGRGYQRGNYSGPGYIGPDF